MLLSEIKFGDKNPILKVWVGYIVEQLSLTDGITTRSFPNFGTPYFHLPVTRCKDSKSFRVRMFYFSQKHMKFSHH